MSENYVIPIQFRIGFKCSIVYDIYKLDIFVSIVFKQFKQICLIKIIWFQLKNISVTLYWKIQYLLKYSKLYKNVYNPFRNLHYNSNLHILLI